MFELVLVRHAEPEWEPGGRAVDRPDLSARGRGQAQRVADALASESFDAFYASPLERVRQTAEPIARALHMEPQIESWLEEVRLPSLQGRTPDQIQTYFRDARTRDLASWWDGPPGGESYRHFYERITAGIEGLLSKDHGANIHLDAGHRLWTLAAETGRVLIVAHEGTIAVLLSHLLGVEPAAQAFLRFPAAHAGITRLETRPASSGSIWALQTFNRIDHLGDLG